MNLETITAATPLEVVSVYRRGDNNLLVAARLLSTFNGFKLLESVCTVDVKKRSLSYKDDTAECCGLLGITATDLRIHNVTGRSVEGEGVLKWQGIPVKTSVPTVDVGVVFEVPIDSVDSLVLASWICQHYEGSSPADDLSL